MINIKGYIAGNPLTNKSGDINSRFEFAYQMTLISKELFESAEKDCNGEYAEADESNLLCMSRIDEVNKRVRDINMSQVLEPQCEDTANLLQTVNPIRTGKQRSVWENPIKMVHAQRSSMDTFISCHADYYYATLWANNKNVMEALDVRKGRIMNEQLLCNADMGYNYGDTSMPLYEFNVQSSVVYHKELSKRQCRALIFSGDHDMKVPHVGFKTTYARDNYSLVFATVKGGGHTVPEYKPKQCFDMVKR
nr:peptidase S10, serine carboxypeptidase, alpha/beta hydrolase fold protein [Tanacetum cinerariifolium]